MASPASSLPSGGTRPPSGRLALREVFANLLKHGRTTRIFGAGHPSAARFREIYLQSAQRYLQEYGGIHVDIDGVRMTAEGQEILGPDSTGAELVAALYGEGVRSLVVRAGATEAELRTLADLMSREWDLVGELDEDLAAALWRAELEHIYIDIADRFSAENELAGFSLRGDTSDQSGRGGGTEAGLGDSVSLREIEALLEELRREGVRAEDVVHMKQDEAALYNQLKAELGQGKHDVGDQDLLPIDPMARKALTIELDELARGEDVPLEWTARIFFEVIRQDETGQGVMELGSYLVTHALDLIERSDPAGAALLVRRALLLMDHDLFSTFLHREALGRGYSSGLLRNEGRRHLCEALARLEDPDQARGPLFSLLAPIIPDYSEALSALCVELPSMELRQVAADRWLTLQDEDEGAILEKLRVAQGAFSVCPMLALARLKMALAIDLCIARVGDADPRVRESALRALRPHQTPGVRRVMLEGLMDTAAGVRTEALRYLTVYRDPQHLSALETQMTADTFAGAAEQEVRAWILAYALIGKATAVPLLRDLATGVRSLPGEPRNIPILAIQGLARTGAPGVESLLSEIGRKDPKLADAVRKARGGGA